MQLRVVAETGAHLALTLSVVQVSHRVKSGKHKHPSWVRMTEPRTRRGVPTVLSPRGEGSVWGAATPAPLGQAGLVGKPKGGVGKAARITSHARAAVPLYCSLRSPGRHVYMRALPRPRRSSKLWFGGNAEAIKGLCGGSDAQGRRHVLGHTG